MNCFVFIIQNKTWFQSKRKFQSKKTIQPNNTKFQSKKNNLNQIYVFKQTKKSNFNYES